MAGDAARFGIARRVIGAIIRFGHFAAIACAVVLGIVPMQASAQVEPPAQSGTIAIIGSSVISDTEIDRIAAGRPSAYADLPPDDRRKRIIDSVVAEYVIDYFYGRDLSQLSPAVHDALNDARRQVLLQFYAQSKFTPPKITETDVADFIARNPALFADRRSYSFVVVTMSGGSAQARQALQDRVQDIAERPEAEIAVLNGLVSSLDPDGVTATISTVWQPSEALPLEVLLRLEAMVLDSRRIDISAEPEVVSILLLNSAVPIPTNPAQLRKRIEQRLIAEAFEVHRDELLRRIAQTVLDPTAVRNADQMPGADLTVPLPPRGEVVWTSRPNLPDNIRLKALFGVGIFGTWASYLLWAWLRLVLAQYEYIRRSGLKMPFLSRRFTGFFMTALAALVLLIGSGRAVTIAMQSSDKTTTGAALVGSVTIAIAMVAVWHFLSQRAFNRAAEKKGRDEYGEDIDTSRKILMRKRNPVKVLAAAAAFVALFGISLALLLDGPTGLS